MKTQFSLCAVNQFLACDAIAHPRNGLETCGIDFLPTIEAFAKCALADPFQSGVHCTQ